jgi:hypothetical protein
MNLTIPAAASDSLPRISSAAWIKARQASGAEAGETASRLIAWMDDDPYAFCYEIEKEAVEAFDEARLTAFEHRIRARLEAIGQADQSSYLYSR